MKVKELIAELQKKNPEQLVTCFDYGGCQSSVKHVTDLDGDIFLSHEDPTVEQ